MRLIIDYPDDMTPADAMAMVRSVISEGRVSTAKGVKHYCWATRFCNGNMVYTRHKARPTSADSFLVKREEL